MKENSQRFYHYTHTFSVPYNTHNFGMAIIQVHTLTLTPHLQQRKDGSKNFPNIHVGHINDYAELHNRSTSLQHTWKHTHTCKRLIMQNYITLMSSAEHCAILQCGVDFHGMTFKFTQGQGM